MTWCRMGERKRHFGWALRIAGVVVVGLLCLALGEVLVRVAAGPPAAFLYTGSFRDVQTDWDVTYSVDEEMRRRSCPAPDPEGKKIAVIGDSFVFGQGVEDCQDFVSLLNQALPQYRFVNFGIIGAGIPEYQEVARDLVDESFSGVIILFYGNDLSPTVSRSTGLIGTSSLLSLLRKFRRQALVRRAAEQAEQGSDRANNIHATVGRDPEYPYSLVVPSEAGQAEFARRFNEVIDDLAAKVGRDHIIVAMAPAAHTVSRSVRAYIQGISGRVAPFGEAGPGYLAVRDLARGKGVRFVETFARFAELGDAGYHPHDFHWNRTGHEAMAELIEPLFYRSEASGSQP